MNDNPATHDRLGSRRERINSYTTIDRQRHAFEGTVQWTGDSLHFVRTATEASGVTKRHEGVDRYVPRDSVAWVQALHGTLFSGLSALLVFGGIGIVVAYGIAIWTN